MMTNDLHGRCPLAHGAQHMLTTLFRWFLSYIHVPIWARLARCQFSVILVRCTRAYALLALNQSILMQSCNHMSHGCVQAICMYAYAHAHKPPMTCHQVATLAPWPPPHPGFPHYTYFLHL